MKAVDPKECHPLRLLLKVHGYQDVLEVLTHLVAQADVVCGGSLEPEECETMAAMMLQSYEHMSLESFVVAIRDGLKKMGSGRYTKIKLPTLMEWLRMHDEDIIRLAEGESAARKEAPGNLGAAFLDDLERPKKAAEREVKELRHDLAKLREKLKTNRGR